MGTDLRTAAQQMLEALEGGGDSWRLIGPAIDAIRAALEQPEQEPVAWIQSNHFQQAQREPFLCRVEPTQRLPDFVPLYTHPPRREWRGLTDNEIINLVRGVLEKPANGSDTAVWQLADGIARAIEAALKERNL